MSNLSVPIALIKVEPRRIISTEDLKSRIPLIRQKYFTMKINIQKRQDIQQINSSLKPIETKSSSISIQKIIKNEFTIDNELKITSSNFKNEKKPPFLKTYYDEYFCDLCGYKSKRKAALAVHVSKKHTNKIIKEKVDYICRLCDITFRCKPSYQAHWIRKHTDEFNYACPKCGKKFKIKGELTTHLTRMHSNMSWKCEVCGNTYRSKHALYTHQKSYHFKPNFRCPHCRKCLVTQENLDSHIRLRHEKKERSLCSVCGKTFNEVWDLRKHQRVHTGEKPFSCSVCSRKFSRLAILNQHLLIHTGVRVYSCDVCNRSFTQKSGLISHRKKHSGDLPPLPVVYVGDIIKPFKEPQTELFA